MVWKPVDKHLKSYFHFDHRYSRDELIKYVSDPQNIEQHRFYPLLRFEEKWIKFRKNKNKITKVRPLRYAARRDAAIYAYYRSMLSEDYEIELARRNISDVPIAYRKIPNANNRGNKCNIDFAKDAFDKIRELGNVDVTIVDISSYFEHLDHDKIKEKWESIIDRPLNKAESMVFKNLTNYSYVDRGKVYERLNLFERGTGKNRAEKRKRKIDKLKEKGHRQICTSQEFRDIICGKDAAFSSLVQKNNEPFGIPQGTPISDLIANIYLIDFDQRLSRWVKKKGGYAYRYSDDIIVILPRVNGQAYDIAEKYLQNSIKLHGDKLEIQPKKVAIGRFIRHTDNSQIYTHIKGYASQNGIEYLGFEYDGRKVQLRNSSLSNAWRKLKKRTYGWARRYVRRYRDRGDDWLRANAPLKFETEKIIKVVSLGESDPRKWTFNRYVKRCERAFADYETVFLSQTKKYRKTAIEEVMQKAFDKAISKHGREAMLKRKKRGPVQPTKP